MHHQPSHAAYAIDVQNIIFSFKIKTRTNARTFPNLRLDHQKYILEKFSCYTLRTQQRRFESPSSNNYLRCTRKRKMLFYFTLYILDYWECNKIVYTSTWLNHRCNSSLYWDILLPIHRRWWQYFNWVCILVSVNHLCQIVYVLVIICLSYHTFLGNSNKITKKYFFFSNQNFTWQLFAGLNICVI